LGTVRQKSAALWLMADAAPELGGVTGFRFYFHHGGGTIESVPATDPREAAKSKRKGESEP
jgi:hypothetical protein